MDHKEMIERVTRRLFWIERVGFLILAFTWSLRDPKFELGFISYNWYLESVKYFQWFWMCTNCLYFLVFVSKKQSGSSFRQPVQESKKVVAELLMIGNPGFLLERFALLFWALSSKHRDTCLLVIFPLLNIYFAWCGSSREFRHNDTMIIEEELFDQENSMDRVVFWVERLGFFILSGSWYFSSTIRKVVGWELFRKCMSRWNIMFWLLTNTLYLLTYVDKNGKFLSNSRKNPNFWTSEMNKYFKSHPGFWLERLAILAFAFALTNFLSLPESQSPASWRMLLELYFSVVFPVFNVYFSWVGYSKEFKKQDTSAVKKFVNITEDHGDFKVINSDDSSAASTIASVLRNILRNQEEMIDKMQEYQKFVVKSKESLQTINQECSVPYAYVEDLLGKIEDLNTKLVDTMQKNHQEYLVKYEDWWDMMLNGLFKDHEEKNSDYKNVETQYSQLPMNDKVEDYKFVADKEEGKDIESDELDDWDDLLGSDSVRFD